MASNITSLAILATPQVGISWSPHNKAFSYNVGETVYSPANAFTSLTEKPITFEATTNFSNTRRSAVAYEWDFGDGSKGYGRVASHIYHFPNLSTQVVLTVTDNKGKRWRARQSMYLENSPTYEQVVLGTAGLVSLWPLNEFTGKAFDAKGGHDATPSAEGLTRAQASLLPNNQGRSTKFDGAKGYFEIPNNAALEIGNTLTFEFWAQVTVTGTKKDIITLGANSGVATFSATTTKLTLTKQGVADVRTAKTGTTDEKGHHFAVTKSGATTKLYKDGVEIESEGADATLEKSNATKYIGRYTGGEFDKGYIQYPAVYNAALSAATILEHYQAGL